MNSECRMNRRYFSRSDGEVKITISGKIMSRYGGAGSYR